jgi:CBS domain containing-hemolysin-like protein
MSDATPSSLDRAASPGLLARLRNFILRRSGEASVREAIEELIDDSETTDGEIGAIDADERALIGNILRLHEATAEDVMVPRAEIVAVDAATPLEDLVQRMAEETHSRIPVYKTKLDDVIGFVHIKDVLAASHKKTHRTVADLVRNILFAAPSIQVLDLLLEMRAARVHMAIVVDEFGGVDGLVTIEDLVEEIVGEIEDEHDEDGPMLVESEDGSILADARARIQDLETLIGVFATQDERDEIDTLGGIVFSTIDRVPRRFEIIAHESGVEFEIVEADARRIKRLRVLRPRKQQDSE